MWYAMHRPGLTWRHPTRYASTSKEAVRLPIITFCSTKGGCGKSTSAVILAGEFARRASVVLIDADPAQRVFAWAERAAAAGRLPPSLTAQTSTEWRTILDEIDEAAAAADWVIVDLQGAPLDQVRSAAFAIGRSDLVLVPSQESWMDAEDALGTLQEVEVVGKSQRRPIPAAIVITRTRIVGRGGTARAANGDLRAQARVLATEIVERDAYSAIFSFGTALRDLPQRGVGNLGAAIENAKGFAAEVEKMFDKEDKQR